MANNTTKKAGSNKSFIDRMGGPELQKIYNIY